VKIWYASAYDQPTGQSRRTYEFSKELVRLGHDLTIFTNSYSHFSHIEYLRKDEFWRVEFIDGIRIVWLKTFPYRGNGIARFLNMLDNARQILRVSKLLGDFPDVVLGPSVPILTGWAAAKLSKRYKVPFIFEVRDVWPAALVDMGGLSKLNPIYFIFRLIEKVLYKYSARISSTLPFLADHVLKSGADPSKIEWLPNGVDLSLYPKDNGYDGGKGRQLVAMYIGGFSLDHDVSSIIKAAKILQESKDERFRFVIIGQGELKIQCIKEAKLLELFNIEFRKPVPKDCIHREQLKADILIAAIADSKSYRFGLNLNKLCGYFASSRPILFSGNTPNNPVKESRAGLSVNAGNPQAIVEALDRIYLMGPIKRVKMGLRGREYAEKVLSMRILGSKMENMLKEAFKENASSN